MIVKCDKCQTRFKIPDEKVTEKGVKVRCTKCQNTFRVSKAAEAAPPPPPRRAPAPAGADFDPFAHFGPDHASEHLETTRPGFFAEGVKATRETPPPPPPMFGGQQDGADDLFDVPTRVAPIPQSVRDELNAQGGAPPPLAFDPSNPFGDFSAPPVAAPPVTVTPPRPAPRPSSDFESTMPHASAFDPFAAIAAAQQPPAPPAPDAASLKAAASSAPLGFDDLAPSGSAPELLGDLPGPSGLFGAPNSPLVSQPLTGEQPAFSPTGSAPDRRLFDMPSAPGPGLGDPDDLVATAAMKRVTVPSQPQAPVVPAPAAASVERPAGRPEDVGMSEARRPSAVRKGLGLVTNLAVGSLLVLGLLTVGTIYLNEGKVDPAALSLEPVKALFARPSELVAVDVSNGLYDTKSGRPVFYVRGQVENRGSAAQRVKVSVQILDGALTLTEGTVSAGASPTPEELYAVVGPKELAELNAKLEKGAVELRPGERAPFLIAFYEFPPELAQYRLKVAVEKAAAGQAAAR